MKSRIWNGRRLLNLLLVVIVGSGLSLAGGCRAAPTTPLALSAPWKVGETAKLSMQQGETGPVVGDWSMSVEAPAEGDGWHLVTLMSIPQASYELKTSVHVARGDLRPVHTDFSLVNKQGTVTLKATYSESVSITGTAYGARQTAGIKLPAPPYFDNEQLVMSLRALPLAKGWQTTVNAIITQSANKQGLTIRVLRQESVTVPAGSFSCWVVEIVGTSQKAWVAVEAPHQLVKYTNESSQLVSVLKSYTPGK
jgi:hypothetical protein